MSVVLVIDYGMGNLASVRRAVEECGGAVRISDRPEELDGATHLILPGVGSFADGMARLRESGWVQAIRKAALEDGKPMLGICLGMQLLADSGTEGGDTAGLGLIPGTVVRLVPDTPRVRIPHAGWNEVWRRSDTPLLDGIPDGTDFYFVHSYCLAATEPSTVLAVTPYCGSFPSVVGRGTVFGTQFHPEKSQPAGFRLLRSFLAQ